MGKFERKEKSQPKHKPAASSGASKAPRPPPVRQPGWKGPTYLHKKPARPNKPVPSPGGSDSGPRLQPQALQAELQQLVLDVFRDAFPASLDFDALKPTLHGINAALAERDFGTAFATEEFREAYAIRWSPSRALCYANLLAHILGSVACDEAWVKDFLDGPKHVSRPRQAVCIGGGASEVMAFGALLRHLKPGAAAAAAGKPAPGGGSPEATEDQVSRPSATDTEDQGGPPPLHLTLVDAASWASVVAKLERGLKTPPALSKYASATARANNAPLIGIEALRVACAQTDVLASSVGSVRGLIGPDAALITLLFTLKDLYATSITKTTVFLVDLSIAAPKGSLLLVVDSVGACAEPDVKKAAGLEVKTYPMAWLLDQLLLDKDGKKDGEVGSSEAAWEKLMGDESRLSRLVEGLEYPASLENMRFQVHLFRKI